MRIRSLHIGSFGRFTDYELKLGPGLNIIYGQNEAGKSTVHAFIGAMLFGIDKGRGKSPRDSLYLKYQPWGAPAAYSGSMDFEHEGVEYRITRVFYQKEKSCSLKRLDTGRVIELEDDSITSLIPELTKSAYYNTVAMGQRKLRVDGDFAGELKNYFANLSMNGGCEVNVPEAAKNLGGLIKQYTGELKKYDRGALEEEYRSLLEREEAQQSTMLEREKLAGELKETERQIEEEEKQLPDVNIPEQEYSDGTDRVETAGRRVSELAEELSRREDEENREHSALEKEHISSKKSVNAGGIITLAGVALSVLCGGRLEAGIWVGLILAVVGLVLFMTAYIRYKDCVHQLRAQKQKTGADVLSGIDPVAELQKAQEELEQARQELDALRQKRGALLKELHQRREKTESLKETKENIKDRLARLDWELEADGDIGSRISELKDEQTRLDRLVNKTEGELEALKLANSVISQLSGELHESFAERFNNIISARVREMTDGAYTAARVTSEYELEVMSGIDYVSAEALSTGTCEQLYIALRLAVAELFFGRDRIPVLFDESFAYCDDDRLKSIMRSLGRQQGQMLVFTCRNREYELAEQFCPDCSTVKL